MRATKKLSACFHCCARPCACCGAALRRALIAWPPSGPMHCGQSAAHLVRKHWAAARLAGAVWPAARVRARAGPQGGQLALLALGHAAQLCGCVRPGAHGHAHLLRNERCRAACAVGGCVDEALYAWDGISARRSRSAPRFVHPTRTLGEPAETATAHSGHEWSAGRALGACVHRHSLQAGKPV